MILPVTRDIVFDDETNLLCNPSVVDISDPVSRNRNESSPLIENIEEVDRIIEESERSSEGNVVGSEPSNANIEENYELFYKFNENERLSGKFS